MADDRRVELDNHREIPNVIFDCVAPYIDDPDDRNKFSRVCREWWKQESLTRKHVTIPLCYSTTPERLRVRYPNIESLKIKGKPRASMFNLVPEKWGGYVTPWLNIIGLFTRLNSLHFRRMIVSDIDLKMIADTKGRVLQSLKLDKCSGFSTDGLLYIGRSCRNLRTLFLEDSKIEEKDGQWLHDLSMINTVLETLNFYLTDLENVAFEDVLRIATNCPLVSLKINECALSNLTEISTAAPNLEEFGGGSFNDPLNPDLLAAVRLPAKIRSLGLRFMGPNEMPVVFPIGHLLTKLDLIYSLLRVEDHYCRLLRRCPNLEVLEALNAIGDSGLETLAAHCKKLKRLRIEPDDPYEMPVESGLVTQRGLIALSQGCLELEYIAIYVSDITNEALQVVGSSLKKLYDFRLVLLESDDKITDFPMDNGVRALLMDCKNLRRFALYLRQGGLTNEGLSYIGRYGENIEWMLLGHVGQSDAGLIEFSKGCPNLQKLELRCCCFSENALAVAMLQLRSLRYLWVQGFTADPAGFHDLMAIRPFWNIELIPVTPPEIVVANEGGVVIERPSVLAYCSLAGQRSDFPEDNSVVPYHAWEP